MNNIKEIIQEDIRARFQELFRDIVQDQVPVNEWAQADIVFRNGKVTNSFDDVEFLMASHHNGASFLYTSQNQGSSVFSVISTESRVSFSIRP